MRQMRRWAMNESDQGPVYLGYRVGHIKSDGRAFRAIIYNKGAMVLHMLRRLVGDEAFFSGLRRFYADSRFSKAAPRISGRRWKQNPAARSSASSSAGSTTRRCPA